MSTGILAKERMALNVGTALLVAGLLLVVAVLPAEYGVDRSGSAEGWVTAMNDVKKELDAFQASRAGSATGTSIIAPQERGYQNETVEFKLAPGGSIEYKYRLDKGEALHYSWKATGPVNYELHGSRTVLRAATRRATRNARRRRRHRAR